MKFIKNLFNFSASKYDEITLIKFSDWLKIYYENEKKPLIQSRMATALIVNGINILDKFDEEYSILYYLMKNKKITSKKLFDFIILKCLRDGDIVYDELQYRPAREALAMMIGDIYENDKNLLFYISHVKK
ncbi:MULTISPECIES: hypothetical protein [Arsenophonus]|uniref:hypothetical protein n=1 Tax=Arsenophonus TaxID=637 RepID=UPI0015D71CC4|nr:MULTISPECIES: hypothetical protein [Arsenophonus]UBX30319.1 hypothetical protein LDL57_06915 [Arsenophonus apicola]